MKLSYKKQIRVTHKGKVIGYYYENDNGLVLFQKNVDSTKHLFIKYDGYGIQKSAFDKLLRGKSGNIEINEEDTYKTYKVSIKTWEEKGKEINYGDNGIQIVLPLDNMVEDLEKVNW